MAQKLANDLVNADNVALYEQDKNAAADTNNDSNNNNNNNANDSNNHAKVEPTATPISISSPTLISTSNPNVVSKSSSKVVEKEKVLSEQDRKFINKFKLAEDQLLISSK